MIRAFRNDDLTEIMQIWLDTNTKAHNFIPKEYWTGNYAMVKEVLPQAEIYVYEDGNTNQVQGFIGLNDSYIEGIFVREEAQSRGVGKQLLNYVKERKATLRLSVYQKNARAIAFYQREQFVIQLENTEEDTRERELIMEWRNVKNIVFDMGNVLVRYDSDRVCRHFIENEEERERVRTSVFVSPEWLMLDMGVISDEDALKKMQARLKSDHEKEMAALCMAHWHEYCMWANPGAAEFVKELKDQGYRIYLCSNASVRLLDCYRQVIPGIEYFDGVLFSAEVKCMKPQKEMYEHLFRRFDLKPEECFFVDDLQLNIEGAKMCGMDGHCFADGDWERLRERIENHNHKL